MIRFTRLYQQLDATTKTNDKIASLVNYFESATPADAAWVTYFLIGNRLKRLVPTKRLRLWAAEQAGIPSWLFDESYQSVGDLAETISLIVPDCENINDKSLHDWICEELKPLERLTESEQRDRVIEIWRSSDKATRFVAMKLITGGFRVGVSKGLLIRALSKHSGVTQEVIAHRLMGN